MTSRSKHSRYFGAWRRDESAPLAATFTNGVRKRTTHHVSDCLTVQRKRVLLNDAAKSGDGFVSKLSAFLLGLALAISVWVVGPIVRPEFGETWFVGSGPLTSITLLARDVLSMFVGVGAWIAALHFPPRPRHIWIRRSIA